MMGTRRVSTLLAAAAVVVVALLASLGPASPVSAAGRGTAPAVGGVVIAPRSYGDCPVGMICVYVATNGDAGAGAKAFLPTSAGSCTWAGITNLLGIHGYLSVYNRTSFTQKLWHNNNCTDSPRLLGSGSLIDNLGSAYWSIGG